MYLHGRCSVWTWAYYTLWLGIGSVSEYLWYMTFASRANGPLTYKDSTFTMQKCEIKIIDFVLKIYLPRICIWISFTWLFSFYTSYANKRTMSLKKYKLTPSLCKISILQLFLWRKINSTHHFWKLIMINSPKMQLQNCISNHYARLMLYI